MEGQSCFYGLCHVKMETQLWFSWSQPWYVYYHFILTVSSHQKSWYFCVLFFLTPLARRVIFVARGRLVNQSSDYLLLSPIPSSHKTQLHISSFKGSFMILLQVPLPSKPHWYLLFGATEEEIKEICITTLRLYTRKKVCCLTVLSCCDLQACSWACSQKSLSHSQTTTSWRRRWIAGRRTWLRLSSRPKVWILMEPQLCPRWAASPQLPSPAHRM